MFWSRVLTWACLLMFSGAASKGCDKTFTSTSGYIRSPGYSGAYPPNLDCTYLIQQTAGFVVRLQFYQVWWWLDKEGESCLDYIQVYDGDSETGPLLGGPYCGDTRPPVLFSTQNVVTIRFHSDNKTYYGNQGFNIGYTAIRKGCDITFTSTSGYIRSPGYSGAYPPNLDCTYLIQQTADFVVRLQFYQVWWWLDKEGESCLDYIQVYDGDSETGPLLGGPYCGDTRPPVLFSTQNVVMIRFHSDNKTYYGNQGFNIGYTAIRKGCDITFTSTSGYIRSPGYSGAYPPNLDCTYLIQQTAGFVVRLQFYQVWWWLDKEGESCLDYIQVYDGDSETGPLLGGPYCGDTRPPVLFSTQNVVMIRFHSDNKTYYGNQGFNIGYTAIRKGCDITFTSTSGYIRSPGYSGAYPPNLDCTYLIQQTADFVVRLQFYQVWWWLDKEGESCLDYIQVYDGDSESAPLLGGPYCGDTRPPPLFSTQNVVMIRFLSDNQTYYGNQGFNIGYTAIRKGSPPPATRTTPTTQVLSTSQVTTGPPPPATRNTPTTQRLSTSQVTTGAHPPATRTTSTTQVLSSSQVTTGTSPRPATSTTPITHVTSTSQARGDCSTGHYTEVSTGQCQPCDVGFYQDEASMSECKQCPPRSTTQHKGSDQLSDCEAEPGVENTASVTLNFALNDSCTFSIQQNMSSFVHAKVVVVALTWSGLCEDTSCGNVKVTPTCKFPTSTVIKILVTIENVSPTLTNTQTNVPGPTETVLRIVIVETDTFDLRKLAGATLLKNEVNVVINWSCGPGYTRADNTCESASDTGVSAELIWSIVGGLVGLIAVVLLVIVVLRIYRREGPNPYVPNQNKDPEHTYDVLAPMSGHSGPVWNSGVELSPTIASAGLGHPASSPLQDDVIEEYDDIESIYYLTPKPEPIQEPATQAPDLPARLYQSDV